jgi:hypothetical protein
MHAEVGPWIKVLPFTPFDQTDITTVNPIHSKCVCGSSNRRDSDRGRVQGRPHQLGRLHLLVRPHLPGVAQ